MSPISASIFGGFAGLLAVLAPIWMSRSSDPNAEIVGVIVMLGCVLFIFLLIAKWFGQQQSRPD
jgi:uncharacterized membrane protein